MQNRGKQKADGYIKNQNMRLKEMRLNILLKISCVIVPMTILMAILWGIFSITPPPEKWEQTQITYSSISREFFAHRGTYVLHTTDGGGYILGIGTKEVELLSQQLIPNQQYSIVYCENLFTRITKSLSSTEKEFIELDNSIAEWENDQKVFHIIWAIMICLMLIGSLISFAFWCRYERQEIQKTKAKISARLSKKQKNERSTRMQYSSVNRLGDFEFHDAELTLISWEDDRLTVSAKYLNVHKDAAPDHAGTDMEITEAIITFCGFDLKEFEPARTWKRDKHGNTYTDDPLVIHTGAVAKSMLKTELQHTVVVMGIAYVDGIYDLGALGIDPYFSARFTFSSVKIEWDSYRKKAWYCSK